jgi:hypothetical protein
MDEKFDIQIINDKSHMHYEKKGVLQLVEDNCNFLFYTQWVLTNKLHEFMSCNSIYILCNSLQLNCNFVKTIHFQLLCTSIIIV